MDLTSPITLAHPKTQGKGIKKGLICRESHLQGDHNSGVYEEEKPLWVKMAKFSLKSLSSTVNPTLNIMPVIQTSYIFFQK